MSTGIEWTDATWNPVTGCSKVSTGCKNCYAETIANRFWKDRKFTDVRMHEDRLDAPLHWRKPRRVFVNSMSDLFHEDVPDEFIDKVFAVMAMCKEHTFQVLTKRADRMRYYVQGWFDPQCAECSDYRTSCKVAGHVPRTMADRVARACGAMRFPLGDASEAFAGMKAGLPNVWLGVSVEDQKTADERIPLLLQTPAAVRFLSCEPLLGELELRQLKCGYLFDGEGATYYDSLKGCSFWGSGDFGVHGPAISWIIVGGESGPGARPCNIAWIRSIVEQCRAAGVSAFVKQLGSRPFYVDGDGVPHYSGDVRRPHVVGDGHGNYYITLRDKKGGDPAEWPEDFRIRQFPEAQVQG